MTPARFWAAVALFHCVLLVAAWALAKKWRLATLCQAPAREWLARLAADAGLLSVLGYLTALAAPLTTNFDNPRHLSLGEISGRLMGQLLFGEFILLAAVLAVVHRRAGRARRAGLLGTAAMVLLGVYVDGYRVEPTLLKVRKHVVDRSGGAAPATVVRILHLTDIQTPTIGLREERALQAGLSYHPDLIVLTGDYVQDALGRPTEERAAFDLRRLIARIRFAAPLGVFATEGDVGPSCAEVFEGTGVRCLVDEYVLVPLPSGETLSITGLSRGGGRERDAAWLGSRLPKASRGLHRIVISHAPDFVDSLPERVDLVLAGHTHGGQVVLPLLGPPRTASRLPRLFAGGLHDYQGTPLHVSRGVGMERGFDVPIRFLCPPEICVLDLRFPSPAPSAGESGHAENSPYRPGAPRGAGDGNPPAP